MSAEPQNESVRFRDRTLFPVLYMFSVMFVSSGALIGLTRFTAERVEANRQVLFERAVLQALHILPSPNAAPSEIHRVFTERVSPPTDETHQAYRLMDAGQAVAYALPIEGQGFWDTIRGIVGIDADGTALTGISFYYQKETPGLGAKITTSDFQNQFRELELDAGVMLVELRNPAADLGEGDVHAITGATQTCARLEDIINRGLATWRAAMGFSAASPQPLSQGGTQ